MMKTQILSACFCACSFLAQAQLPSLKELSLVPYPKETQDTQKGLLKIENGFSVACAKELSPLADLLIKIGRAHV